MRTIVICGNADQVQEIQARIKTTEADVVAVDLTAECFNTPRFEKDAIFVVADDVQENLALSCNLSINSMINYSRFKKTALDNPMEKMNGEMQYTGLILGMSHAQCAIDPAHLTGQTYCNCAAPSMDIFCQLYFLRKLAKSHRDVLHKIQHVIIELPYYIFNYDLSRFGTFVYTKLNYFELVGDYHHFGMNEEQKNIIEEFRRFKGLFGAEEFATNDSIKKNFIRQIAKKVLNKYRIARNKDNVWHVIYNETIKENQQLWKDLSALLADACPNATVTILVMPFNPIFRLFHKKEIRSMRKLFVQSLGSGTFQLIDHFSCIKRDSYFDDHCHLNKKGASEYINVLNEALANK